VLKNKHTAPHLCSMQWCMRRGYRGRSRTLWFGENLGKIREIRAQSVEIWATWKPSRNPWKSGQAP